MFAHLKCSRAAVVCFGLMLLGPANPHSADAQTRVRVARPIPSPPELKVPGLALPGLDSLGRPRFPDPEFGSAARDREEPGLGKTVRRIEAFKLNPGMLRDISRQNFLVRDDVTGQPVVAGGHVEFPGQRFVLLDDGALVQVESSQTTPTDQPFKPLDIKGIEAKVLRDIRLQGFRTIRSKRFLFVYSTTEGFIRSTRLILETMYPAIRTFFKRSSINLHDPEFPLVVIAFATERQYQEFRRMPRGVIAYYNGMSNHVALYERSELSTHAPEIALKNAISTVAHEGVHQILHNIGVQQRLSAWPMWLSEGLAEYFAPTSVRQGGKWSGLGSTNQLRMHEIAQDWKSGGRRSPGSVLENLVAAEQLDSLEYAYCWALIHMLARRHRGQLLSCAEESSRIGPLTELTLDRSASSRALFEKFLGSEYGKLEQELEAHLRGLRYVDPVASQTVYLVVSGNEVFITSSPERVQQMQNSSAGQLRVQTFPNAAAAEAAMRRLTGR